MYINEQEAGGSACWNICTGGEQLSQLEKRHRK